MNETSPIRVAQGTDVSVIITVWLLNSSQQFGGMSLVEETINQKWKWMENTEWTVHGHGIFDG